MLSYHSNTTNRYIFVALPREFRTYGHNGDENVSWLCPRFIQPTLQEESILTNEYMYKNE